MDLAVCHPSLFWCLEFWVVLWICGTFISCWLIQFKNFLQLKCWMISAFFSGTTAWLGGKGTSQGKGTWKRERARKAEGRGSGARSQETQRVLGGLWWWTWWCKVLQVSTFCLFITCTSLSVFFSIFLLQLHTDHHQYHVILKVHLSGTSHFLKDCSRSIREYRNASTLYKNSTLP